MPIKSNQETISNLVLEYEKIKTSLTLVLNEEEWRSVPEKIDLIVIGDNPGRSEKKFKKYLIGANAGKRGRNFISFALKELELSNFLILNKTPFYSSVTNKLIDDSNKSVEKSIIATISAVKTLININPKIIVIILGHSENIVNEKFFTYLSLNIDNNFRKNLYYISHPSHGHLDAELMSYLYTYLVNDTPINLLKILEDIKRIKTININEKYETIL
jgi:hypothetical protein